MGAELPYSWTASRPYAVMRLAAHALGDDPVLLRFRVRAGIFIFDEASTLQCEAAFSYGGGPAEVRPDARGAIRRRGIACTGSHILPARGRIDVRLGPRRWRPHTCHMAMGVIHDYCSVPRPRPRWRERSSSPRPVCMRRASESSSRLEALRTHGRASGRCHARRRLGRALIHRRL